MQVCVPFLVVRTNIDIQYIRGPGDAWPALFTSTTDQQQRRDVAVSWQRDRGGGEGRGGVDALAS